MNYKIYINIILLTFAININAQTPNWLWAKSAGGHGPDIAYDIANDGKGSIYITGYWSGVSTFGSFILNNSGGLNTFIAKYNSKGSVIWAKGLNGSFNSGAGITCDSAGNILVLGFFSDTLVLNTDTLISVGDKDIYIAKYDTSGNALWAKSCGGSGIEYGQDVAIDTAGNILVTGTFVSDSIMVGPYTLYNSNNTNSSDFFISKYDPNGNTLWAKAIGGLQGDYNESIACDKNGNVILTGNFNSSTLTIATTTLTGSGQGDAYIIKYDANGNLLWAKSSEGGTSADKGSGIATDLNNNILVSGFFYSDTIRFGSTTLSNSGFSSTADIFIVKYDPSGNVLWAKSYGGSNGDFGTDVSCDISGDIVILGSFTSTSINWGTSISTNNGVDDLFVLKCDASGNTVWAKSAGGNMGENANAITIDENGDIYTMGYFFSSSIPFGSSIVYNKLGAQEIYIAKLDHVISWTGINEIANENMISIYPNPNNGNFTIKTNNKDAFYKIYNSLGQMMQLIELNAQNNFTVIISGLDQGLYFISSADGGMDAQKVIVVK